MSEEPKYHVLKIKSKNPDNPFIDAESTPEIDRLIKQKSDVIPLNKIHFAARFGNVPCSVHSKVARKKFLETMKTHLEVAKENGAKLLTRNIELQVDLMFFITEDYDTRDLDRLISPLLDSLQGYLFENDSQIKRITAEKHHITDIDESIDKRFYEQICCVISVP